MEKKIRKHFNSINTTLILKLIQPILQHYKIEYINLTKLDSIAILDKYNSDSDLYLLKGLIYQLCRDEINMKKCYKNAGVNGNLMLGMYYSKGNNDKCIKYYVRAIENKNSDAMYNLGLYYKHANDVPNMIKYYQLTIEHGNSKAMCNLGLYYKHANDVPNMTKYYLMAIEHENSDAMFNLGLYYKHANDVPNMTKYYLMAIEHGNSKAMCNLGLYYDNHEDVSNMLKYYQMAIEHRNSNAMCNLGLYYDNHADVPNMLKYYQMAIEHGNSNALQKLANYHETNSSAETIIEFYHQNFKYNAKKLIDKLTSYIGQNYKDISLNLLIKSFMLVADKNNDKNKINLNTYILKKINSYNETNADYDEDTKKCIINYINLEHDVVQNNMAPSLRMYKKLYDEKIDLLDCHFKYSPGGEGFKEAKDDFIKFITH